jgi:hypothetical protein
MRCREQIKTLAQNAGDPLPTTHAVIENLQRHGYRLNPDQVRIVALSEIRRSEKVTLFGEKVTLPRSLTAKSTI